MQFINQAKMNKKLEQSSLKMITSGRYEQIKLTA
jgi:hypothetical protein